MPRTRHLPPEPKPGTYDVRTTTAGTWTVYRIHRGRETREAEYSTKGEAVDHLDGIENARQLHRKARKPWQFTN